MANKKLSPLALSKRALCLSVLILVVAMTGIYATSLAAPQPQPTELEKKWGIDIQSLRLSANGYMLDFRFRVLDTEKSKMLFSRDFPPFLHHQASGAKLAVPNTGKAGPMRSTYPPKADRIYFMLFGNAGKVVSPGDKVSIEVGAFLLKNMTVE